MRRIAVTFAAFTVVAPLCSQTEAAPAAPAVPPPFVVIDTVGPAGWRTRLGPTNLGTLLASERGRQLWEPGVLPLLTQWQQLVGDEQQFAAARERLLGYGGRVRFAVRVSARGEDTVPLVAIVLDGDGRTDMKLLAADIRGLQQNIPGEWKHERLGEHDVEVCTQGDDAVTGPVLAGDQVLFAVAKSADTIGSSLAFARAFAATQAPPLTPASPALRIDVDFAAFAALMQREVGDDDGAVMRALGVPSVAGASLQVGTAGPQVQVESSMRFKEAPGGLFAAFFPPTTGVPELQSLLGDGAVAWKVGRFDWRALYTSIRDAVIASGETTREELEKEMRDELGIDLDADLFAHTTDEVMFELRLDEIERIEDASWVLTVGLRDEAAFDKSLLKLLEGAKPMLTRAATTKIGDVDLHRYGGMFGYDVWLATCRGRLLVAGGREAEESLTAAVTKLADKDRAPTTPATDAFREQQRHLPPGNNGLARSGLDEMAALPAALWLGLFELGGLPFDGGVDDEQRELVRELLRANNLATIRTATGFAERTWRWRLYW